MSYLGLDYIGKSSLRLVIRENEKKGPAYITKYQYQSKIRQKASSTPRLANRNTRKRGSSSIMKNHADDGVHNK
jgi:hypothetical protein